MTSYELNRIRGLVKEHHPLIHCITNPISINQCANAVLAVGARPIMAEHPDEVKEITNTAQALMLNLGNITDARIKSITISSESAKENSIPSVIDVVGIACSELRRKFACKLIEKTQPTVIKGNYSEINALYNSDYKSAGVDAENVLDSGFISNIAAKLATKYNTIILASGKTDIITDGKKIVSIRNGTSQLASVTGTGCMLGALCGCYLSAAKDITAISAACAVLGICGEMSETDKGSASFMINLIDKLSVLKNEDIEKYLDLEETKIDDI